MSYPTQMRDLTKFGDNKVLPPDRTVAHMLSRHKIG